jgi:hypothetical protein
LSHNLAREWVTDRLGAAGIKLATAESEWIGKGVAWPQTSGEHDDPTGVAEPEIVKVFVTVPAATTDAALDSLIDFLRTETDAEPALGGRVESGSMRAGHDQVQVVDDLDLGANARRVGLTFTITGPLEPVG